MLKDMTIGQYYPGNSLIHRLDPRVKLLGTLVFIISLFTFSSISAYALATVAVLTVVAVSRVPLRYILKGLKPIFILMLITILFNLFMTPGTAVLQIWKLKGWMNRLHVPVHEIAMMMSIALRFIPILMDETDKIMRAQEARGADFQSGGVFHRVKAMVPLLVPLFVSAFRRANDLALAMEARGYHGGAGRTKMKPLVYHRKDWIAFLVMAGYVAAQILLRIFVKI